MTHPRRASRDPLKGATLAVWQSQSRGEMTHPRRALRDPLKGATLAVWQSQSRGVLS